MSKNKDENSPSPQEAKESVNFLDNINNLNSNNTNSTNNNLSIPNILSNTNNTTSNTNNINNNKNVYINMPINEVWTINKKDFQANELLHLIKTYHDLEFFEIANELAIKFLKIMGYERLIQSEQVIVLSAFKSHLNTYMTSWKNLMNYKAIYIKNQSYSNTMIIDNPNDDGVDLNDSMISSQTTKVDLSNNINQISFSINQKIIELEETIQLKSSLLAFEIDQLLEKAVSADERTQIFYSKTKADIIHCYCEVANEEEFATFVDVCEKLYQSCFDLSFTHVKSNDYLYLDIAYNYSVFTANILNNIADAYSISNKAYLRAKGENPNFLSQEFKFYIDLLEKKLVIWKTDFIDFV